MIASCDAVIDYTVLTFSVVYVDPLITRYCSTNDELANRSDERIKRGLLLLNNRKVRALVSALLTDIDVSAIDSGTGVIGAPFV